MIKEGGGPIKHTKDGEDLLIVDPHTGHLALSQTQGPPATSPSLNEISILASIKFNTLNLIPLTNKQGETISSGVYIINMNFYCRFTCRKMSAVHSWL